MNTAAGTVRTRAALAMTALLVLAATALSPSPAAAAGHPAGQGLATASIVHGKSTSIKDWPWQVAIAVGADARPDLTPQERVFCGGSLIAPDLVITAGHCVADVSKKNILRTDVITGRTYLNNDRGGEVAHVIDRYMPTYANGKRKFSNDSGAADWDVALLRLDRSVPGTPIKLAGNDELDSWKTGQVVKTTGWGITTPKQRNVENGLRLAGQVLLPPKICERWDGSVFNVGRMVCFGAPSIHSSPCNGDSGGPLMAKVGTAAGSEYRLVGLTSWGDSYCRGVVPSVDSRVAGQPLLGWIKRKAQKVSGVDVVGHGGTPSAVRQWCRVPDMFGDSLHTAKRKLARHNCRLGSITRDREAGASSGTITYTDYLSGWLAKPGARIGVGRVP